MKAIQWNRWPASLISLGLILLMTGFTVPACTSESASPSNSTSPATSTVPSTSAVQTTSAASSTSTATTPSRAPTTALSPTTASTAAVTSTATALPGGITPGTTPASAASPPTTCPSSFTVEMTEGPYYKSGAPQRTELVEAGTAGTPLTLTGYVLDKNCAPIAGAWLDFWQADGNGVYDNSGYKLRGYQLTDAQGKYTLHTVIPGIYPGRTEHIHVKVSKSEALARSESAGSIVTSQLFFPEAAGNSRDSIFSPSMVVSLSQSSDGRYIAFFNFKLNQ